MVCLTDYWSRTEPKLRAALDLVNGVLAEYTGMRVDWATDYIGSNEIPVNWSKANPKASLGLIQYDRDRWHVLCWCQLKDVPSGQVAAFGQIIAVNEAGFLSIGAVTWDDPRQDAPLQVAGPIDDLSVEAFADLIAEGIRAFIRAEPQIHEGIRGIMLGYLKT